MILSGFEQISRKNERLDSICKDRRERIAHVALPSFALFKERIERFALVAYNKRATVSDSLMSLFRKELFRSFDHKKLAILSENR